MASKSLKFEYSRCIGCRLCEIICSLTHDQVINPEKARIRIVRDHEKQIDRAIYCHQCLNAPCIESCDYEALRRDNKTDAIIVEEENCVACQNCVTACPYIAPKLVPSGDYIFICDLCGGSPECEQICPENAIKYLKLEKMAGEQDN